MPCGDGIDDYLPSYKTLAQQSVEVFRSQRDQLGWKKTHIHTVNFPWESAGRGRRQTLEAKSGPSPRTRKRQGP